MKPSAWARAVAAIAGTTAVFGAAAIDPRVDAGREDTYRWSVTPAYDFFSGDYGSSATTDIHVLSATGRYHGDRVTARLTLPYVFVSGPGNVVASGEGRGATLLSTDPRCNTRGRGTAACAAGSGTTTGTIAEFSDSGPGDVVAAATLHAIEPRASSGWALDLTGKVKFGTADERKSLGTGEDDYSVQVDVSKDIADWSPFAAIGYRWFGDPAGIDLRDTVFGTLGAGYYPSRGVSLAAALDWREANVAGADDLLEVSLAGSWRTGRNGRLRAYVLKGLTDGGPDWGTGVSFGWYF
jgi:hypothetical protein